MTTATASEAGLSRGDFITSVNGRTVPRDDRRLATIGAHFGAAENGVATTIEWETHIRRATPTRAMVKRLVTIPTVSLTSVVDIDGRRVGYLFFPQLVEPSKAALTEAFACAPTAGRR
jgi:C-terminal processing protease CtpA/Prc